MADEDLKKEAAARFEDARQHKAKFNSDLSEAYYFADPTRHRDMNGSAPAARNDASELATSIAQECAEDFATLIISTFFPDNENWAARLVKEAPVGQAFSPEEAAQLQTDMETADNRVFEEIRSSNLMVELAKTFTPDAAVGTVAVHIDPVTSRGPIGALGIPLTELFCTIGPDGSIDDRFIERHTTAKRVYGLMPGLKNADNETAAKWRKTIAEQPEKKCALRWGWWRDWTETVETWRWVALIDGEPAEEGRVRGEGSCPLVVGRFGAKPEYALGTGPLIKSLPELRKLDEQRILMIEALDHIIRPPITYPSDSYADIEHGIEAGKAYPVDPNSQVGAFQKLYEPTGLDAAYFDEERSERTIRRLHYIDKPEQRGDTPPTLGQWMSEIELGQRRFGVPGKVFWHEVPRAIFMRFLFILEQRGVIPRLKAREQDVITEAVNPSQRAQDMQNVANTGRFIELGGNAFPEEFKVKVDGGKTLENLVEKLGVEDIVAMRSAQDVQAAATLIAPLVGGQAPGVQPSPGLVSGPGVAV